MPVELLVEPSLLFVSIVKLNQDSQLKKLNKNRRRDLSSRHLHWRGADDKPAAYLNKKEAIR